MSLEIDLNAEDLKFGDLRRFVESAVAVGVDDEDVLLVETPNEYDGTTEHEIRVWAPLPPAGIRIDDSSGPSHD